MSLAWLLLIFIVVAAFTVFTSIVVQHLSVGRSNDPHDSNSPRLLDQVARPRGEDARLDDTDPHGIPVPRDDAGGSTTGEADADQPGSHRARTLQARAEELEAVAQRERRYAERAEAEARRLRAWSRRGSADTTTEQRQRQRQRRAGAAPEDLDY